MSTITYCDKCKKKIISDDIDKKFGMTMRGNISESLTILDDKQPSDWPYNYRSFEFCPKCAKVMLPKIVNILKKK